MKFTSVFKKNAKSKTRLVINQGGSSSSKTYSILQLLYMIAYRSETPLIISVVSESLPHLKRGAMRDFFKILYADNLYKKTYHNKSDRIYTVNKSIIEFFSVDDESKVRGSRRDILYMNECNNISYSTFEQLEIRTKHRIYLDYNPSSEFWVHTKIMPNRSDYTYIQSTYRDNEYLDQNIIKAIEIRKEYDEMWWKVFGLGEVGGVEGLCIPRFEIIDSMPESYKIECYGMDFGYTNDPTTLIRCCIIDNSLYLDEMIYSKGMTNDIICRKLQSLGLIRDYDEIIADSSEPKSITEIYRDGWNIKGAVKGKDSILNGLQLINQHKIYVTERSHNLIKELRNYKYQTNKTDGELVNKPIDDFNHCIDAIRYAVQAKVKKFKSLNIETF